MKYRQEELITCAVPGRDRQGREAGARWAWVEPQVWTERMLAALEKGVKGTNTSRTWDCSALKQPGNSRANLHDGANH